MCLALHLGVCSDCWFCLHSSEHRGPPSGTNSAKQSPAPQHRPLGPAQSSASSTDRYRALGLRRRTENNQTSLELLNARVTFASFCLSVGELRKVKLEKKFQTVTGFRGLSISTWHNLMLAVLQVLAAVIHRHR